LRRPIRVVISSNFYPEIAGGWFPSALETTSPSSPPFSNLSLFEPSHAPTVALGGADSGRSRRPLSPPSIFYISLLNLFLSLSKPILSRFKIHPQINTITHITRENEIKKRKQEISSLSFSSSPPLSLTD
jgi:hypothetical protein